MSRLDATPARSARSRGLVHVEHLGQQPMVNVVDSKGVVTATVSDSGDVTYTVSRYAAGQISEDISSFFAEDQDVEVTAECVDPVEDGHGLRLRGR